MKRHPGAAARDDGGDAREPAISGTPEAAEWIRLLGRTLKTWRLYDASHASVASLRTELADRLTTWLEAHGSLTLRFTSQAVLHHEHVLHQVTSRDDLLSLVFFRDGIESITFMPGIPLAELEQFLTHVVAHMRRTPDLDSDLVTALWDAALEHIDMRYVSTEVDVDVDGEGSVAGQSKETDAGRAAPMGWPKAEQTASAPTSDTCGAPRLALVPQDATATPRSEDWNTTDPTSPMTDDLDRLEQAGEAAMLRFRLDRQAEQEVDTSEAMIVLLDQALKTPLLPEDRHALALPAARFLEEAINQAHWTSAHHRLDLLNQCDAPDAEASVWAKLGSEDSPSCADLVRKLDQQPQADVNRFLELITRVGPSALDGAIRILAGSQQQRVRRPLSRTLTAIAATDPGRLTAWISDSRWYLVRNLMMILHGVGGDDIAPLLRLAHRHPERRVRIEVLGALGTVSYPVARPLLIEMLGTDDARELSGVLRSLARERDPEVTRLLLDRLASEDFHLHAEEAHRAVASALAITADDSIIPVLLERLDPPRRPAPEAEHLFQAVARCLAKLATPAARTALQQAMASRWPMTREAARLALVGLKAA